jgi:hypothetical protein
MIRTLLTGLWICVVAAASAIGVGWFEMRSHASQGAGQTETVFRKMDAISVPKIAGGALQGYVVARFGLTLDGKLAKEQKIAPEILVFEDAYRLLFADQTLDSKHLETYDIKSVAKQLVQQANLRLKADVVKDVSVEEFDYVSKAELGK